MTHVKEVRLVCL
jgi:hypothetical protein